MSKERKFKLLERQKKNIGLELQHRERGKNDMIQSKTWSGYGPQNNVCTSNEYTVCFGYYQDDLHLTEFRGSNVHADA